MLAKQFLKEKVDEEINFQESDFGMLVEGVGVLGLEPEVEVKSEEPKVEVKGSKLDVILRSFESEEPKEESEGPEVEFKKLKRDKKESKKPKLNLLKIGMVATVAGLEAYGLTKYSRKDEKEN